MINKTPALKKELGKCLTLNKIQHMMKITLLKGGKMKLAYCMLACCCLWWFFFLVFCKIFEFSTSKPRMFPYRIHISVVILTLNKYDAYSDVIKKGTYILSKN